MILDLVDTRTNKLVFRGAGAAVIGGPESNAGKIRDAVKKRVAAAPALRRVEFRIIARVGLPHFPEDFVHLAFSEIRF